MTYSRMRMHTTIGAFAFHFRVRNGIGWFHKAIVTRERVEGRRLWTTALGGLYATGSRSMSSAHALKGGK